MDEACCSRNPMAERPTKRRTWPGRSCSCMWPATNRSTARAANSWSPCCALLGDGRRDRLAGR
eukprot:11420197-Alexandrium_andersonii.AAC.1